MSATPITDKIIEGADACPETRIVFLIKHLANKCREFEHQIVSRNDRIRQLEKENYAMMSDTNEYREVLRVLGMEEEGSAVQEILRLLKAEADLRTERDSLLTANEHDGLIFPNGTAKPIGGE